MNFTFFIAKRYFSTKKKNNFVHIISRVSLFGVAIGTAALVLVLSVFNGFEHLILDMYNSFDPHIKIVAKEGKCFSSDSINIKLNNDNIEYKSFVLEEKALLKFQEKEFIATVKGVSEEYLVMTNFDSLLISGEYFNNYESDNVAVIGRGVAYYLSVAASSMFNQIQVFLPNRESKTLLNPANAFKQTSVVPTGVFGIQAEVDQEYIITPLSFLQKLSERENQVSAVEISLKDDSKLLEVQKQLQKTLGEDYVVVNRFEQQEFLYKILNTEKLAVFLILAFIMVIATFNIIGAISMLMLDKKKDIQTFRSLGVLKSDVQKIFFKKSMLTIFYGVIVGISIGLLLAYLQQAFGFITMGGGSFVINTYPVAVKFTDVILVSATVLVIGLLASWYPAKILTKKLF